MSRCTWRSNAMPLTRRSSGSATSCTVISAHFGGNAVPGGFQLAQQTAAFIQYGWVVFRVSLYQTAHDVVVERVEVGGQLSTLAVVQTARQTTYDVDGLVKQLAFTRDFVSCHGPFGLGNALQGPLKQHLHYPVRRSIGDTGLHLD